MSLKHLARLLLRRLGVAVFVVLGVTVVTFLISHLIPADVARLIAGDLASEDTVQRIREQLGLNKPLLQQYNVYLSGLMRGDLGTSISSGRPVLSELALYLPATLELTLVAWLLSVVLGVVLGVYAAAYHGTWIDQLLRFIAVGTMSSPSFWLGLLFIYLFYGTLGWLPGGGRSSVEFLQLPRPTGLLLVDTLLAGSVAGFLDALRHLLMPALVLALLSAGALARVVRAELLEVLSLDYVRTARAAGIPESTLLWKNALPNALIPVITLAGLQFAGLLSGAVVTEMIFNWPGLGSYMMFAITRLDFPVIMGFTVLVSVIYVLVNVITDILYQLADPQIRQVR